MASRIILLCVVIGFLLVPATYAGYTLYMGNCSSTAGMATYGGGTMSAADGVCSFGRLTADGGVRINVTRNFALYGYTYRLAFKFKWGGTLPNARIGLSNYSASGCAWMANLQAGMQANKDSQDMEAEESTCTQSQYPLLNGSNLNLNTWYNISMVYNFSKGDKGNITYYLNGVYQGYMKILYAYYAKGFQFINFGIADRDTSISIDNITFAALEATGNFTTVVIAGIYKNITNAKKTSFKEQEGIIAYANVTLSNGSILANSQCNVTFNNTARYSMAYNATSKIYKASKIFSTQYHQTIIPVINCTNPNPTFNAVVPTSLTIQNLPPTATIDSLKTNDSYYVASDLMTVEYSTGLYIWNVTASDNDFDDFIFILRNSTAILWRNTSTKWRLVNFSSQRVVKSAIYNFSAAINDTVGASVYRSVRFKTNDTAIPVCSGLQNNESYTSPVYKWKVRCTDEYFYLFNISCDSGYSFFEKDIGLTAYDFLEQTIVPSATDALVCQYEYCDGHTDKLIKPMPVSTSANNLTIGANTLSVNAEVVKFTWTKLEDRYSFCIQTAKPLLNYTIKIPPGCHKAEASPYPGHLLCDDPRQWWDFSNPDIKVYVDDAVHLDLSAAKNKTMVCFNSVGKFNCMSGTQAIVRGEPIDANMTNISNTVTSVFLAIFWLAFFFASLALRGPHGNHLMILSMGQLFFGLVLGLNVNRLHSPFMGTCIWSMAILTFVIIVWSDRSE